MTDIVVIAHNIRSVHNIGSIFRTCEGFGVKKLIISGYSPYPRLPNDNRLPHVIEKLTKQLHKTALGAENLVDFEYQNFPNIQSIKNRGYLVVGLEQNNNSIKLYGYRPTKKIALIIGEEVSGIPGDLLKVCDEIIEIPMYGEKESFNVSVATGIALYQLSISQ